MSDDEKTLWARKELQILTINQDRRKPKEKRKTNLAVFEQHFKVKNTLQLQHRAIKLIRFEMAESLI